MITATVTKFFWKNKILIPCVLFAASFIMLTKNFRHSGSEGSKQPVEYLETIDFPEENDRKMSRNQLSWNEMEKMDQNVLFKDIYKDFKHNNKGKEFEGQGYVGVKGEGEVEVVEGYERDAWVSRTYDPLSLLQDQGQFIDLETIDDYVIKAPDDVIETRRKAQLQYEPREPRPPIQVEAKPAWKGSYVIKAEQVEFNTNIPPKKVIYDVYDAEIKKRKRARAQGMNEIDGLFQKKQTDEFHQLAIQSNELQNFQYPPVQKFGKRKRKGSKKRWQHPETVVVHLENAEQIDVNPQVNTDEDDIDDTTTKVKRMGKKKRKKKKFQVQNEIESEVRPQDSVILQQQNQNAQGHGMVLTYQQGQDQNLIPRKIYPPLDSEIAQRKNSNIFAGKQNQGVQNFNQVDSYHVSRNNKLQNSQYKVHNIPQQQIPNNQQNKNTEYQAQDARLQSLQQHFPQQQQQHRHSNIERAQHINQNDFLQLRSLNQQAHPQQQNTYIYTQQNTQNNQQLLDKQPSLLQQQQILPPNMHPSLQKQHRNQGNSLHNQGNSKNKQVYIDNSYQQHNQQHEPHQKHVIGDNYQWKEQQRMYKKQQPVYQPQPKYNQQRVQFQNNKHGDPYQQSQPLKFITMQQQKEHHPQQQMYQKQWQANSQKIGQFGLSNVGQSVNANRHRSANLEAAPLPSLGSLISQQNFMLDVQREISEQYAHIQQLQSKLAIANYVAKEMVHKPHEVPNDNQKVIKGHSHANYEAAYRRNLTYPHVNAHKHEVHNMDGGQLNDQRKNARYITNVGLEDIVLGDGKADQMNVHDKFNVQSFHEERVYVGQGGGESINNVRGNGLLHDTGNGKTYDRFGNVIPIRNSQGTEGVGDGEFKLKHKRKPKNLQNSSQTRVYAFENRVNESMALGGKLSVDIYNCTMFPLNSTLDLAGIRHKLQKLSDQTSDTGKFTRHLRKNLYRDPDAHLELFSQWRLSKDTLCKDSDTFEGYDDKFACLRNVVIDKQFSVGKAGGENITEVINQEEGAEYYKVNI